MKIFIQYINDKKKSHYRRGTKQPNQNDSSSWHWPVSIIAATSHSSTTNANTIVVVMREGSRLCMSLHYCCQMPELQITETNAEPYVRNDLSRTPNNAMVVIYFLHGGAVIFFTWIYKYCAFSFPSLPIAYRDSGSTTIQKPTECLTHWYRIPHNISLQQELTL